jgi:hypothetical protein
LYHLCYSGYYSAAAVIIIVVVVVAAVSTSKKCSKQYVKSDSSLAMFRKIL